MYLSTYSSLYFIIDTYHLEFSTVKVSLERSTRKTIKHKPELDAYALNPSFKTYQPILDIDKLDINIDLVKCNDNRDTAEYVDTLLTNNFMPAIILPTWITS